MLRQHTEAGTWHAPALNQRLRRHRSNGVGMLSTIQNTVHKSAVLGLVGLTFAGGYTIVSGLVELRTRRLAAAEKASAPTTQSSVAGTQR